MARDQEVTAKFAVQEAQVKYNRAVAASAKNTGNSPDARRDRAAVAEAKVELDAAIAMSKDPRNAVTPTAIEASPYNVRSTVGDELLKKQAAIDASNAANVKPVTVTTPVPTGNTGSSVATVTPISVSTSVPADDMPNFTESVTEAAGMDSSSYAVDAEGDRTDFTNVLLADLTAEERAAIGVLDTNQGLGNSGFSAAQIPGAYKSDPKTGMLYLDGSPYTGSYNGFNYISGVKTEATVGRVAKSMADFAGTGGVGASTFSATGVNPTSLETADAFAVIRMILDSYGIGDELAEELIGYMTAGKGPEESLLLIKQNPTGAYKKRFAGNELRIAAGLNVMSEKDYLDLEDTYAETLRKYGLGNMLSTDRKANQAMFAKYMANDLNAPEFKDRIALATERVINADAVTRGMFKEFYPTLTDADLVAYFLSPTDTLTKLKEKVTSAEIGGIALSQGLETNITSAIDLAKFGVDKAAAIEGYSAIKDVLPTSQKLGNVYQEAGIKYDQASGEAEFFKQNQDAKLKRKRLESLERGSFSASAGNASTAYKTNIAGQI